MDELSPRRIQSPYSGCSLVCCQRLDLRWPPASTAKVEYPSGNRLRAAESWEIFSEILKNCTAFHDASIAVDQNRDLGVRIMRQKFRTVLLALGQIDVFDGGLA